MSFETVGTAVFTIALGRLEVLLEQERRDREHVADVVEAIARVVGRELLLGLEVEAHQVADRVAVLDPVEPADRHAARVGVLGIDAEDVVLDPVGQEPRPPCPSAAACRPAA